MKAYEARQLAYQVREARILKPVFEHIRARAEDGGTSLVVTKTLMNDNMAEALKRHGYAVTDPLPNESYLVSWEDA